MTGPDVFLDAGEPRLIAAELETLIQKAALAAFKFEHFTADCETNISVVDDKYIRELNLRHRGLDEATDVLSFPFCTRGELVAAGKYGRFILGDIVVSTDTAAKQADEYGHGIEREFAFLTVHGVLHLLGYDHEDPGEEIIMEDKQKKILELMRIGR